ncbi:unnamed protein product [Darwinula stevensoni]|uniref:Coiled-coil domain-containing protein 9 n=1 Tax=Darwinula stevensoni TaxID=69355 RepID=A0A7R9ADI5_9CRUS|nr:unnamed protein product [Darwinula stevensoni]CAG0901130.1 unnamed protein product [Darwinula stevensoni]
MGNPLVVNKLKLMEVSSPESGADWQETETLEANSQRDNIVPEVVEPRQSEGLCKGTLHEICHPSPNGVDDCLEALCFSTFEAYLCQVYCSLLHHLVLLMRCLRMERLERKTEKDEEELEKRIARIRQQNEEILRRQKEIEEDKKRAADIVDEGILDYVPEERHKPRVPREKKSWPPMHNHSGREKPHEDESTGYGSSKLRPGDLPPPDPPNWLHNDPDREGDTFQGSKRNVRSQMDNDTSWPPNSRNNKEQKATWGEKVEGDGDHRYSSSRSAGKQMRQDPQRKKYERNTHNKQSEERWREERRRVDEERIQRQKLPDGSWKREWDLQKDASSRKDHVSSPREEGQKEMVFFKKSGRQQEQRKGLGRGKGQSQGMSGGSESFDNMIDAKNRSVISSGESLIITVQKGSSSLGAKDSPKKKDAEEQEKTAFTAAGVEETLRANVASSQQEEQLEIKGNKSLPLPQRNKRKETHGSSSAVEDTKAENQEGEDDQWEDIDDGGEWEDVDDDGIELSASSKSDVKDVDCLSTLVYEHSS